MQIRQAFSFSYCLWAGRVNGAIGVTKMYAVFKDLIENACLICMPKVTKWKFASLRFLCGTTLMYLLHTYLPFKIALKSKSIWVFIVNLLFKMAWITVNFACFFGQPLPFDFDCNPSNTLLKCFTLTVTRTLYHSTVCTGIHYISFYILLIANMCGVTILPSSFTFCVSVFIRDSSR